MGSYMNNKKKAHLLKLAIEINAEVNEKMTVKEIVRAIRNLGDEDEQFNAALLNQIIEEEREEIEREEKRLKIEREDKRLEIERENKRMEMEERVGWLVGWLFMAQDPHGICCAKAKVNEDIK